MFIIYVDGSCIRNLGPGGYAAIIIAPDSTQRRIIGSESHTTNSRMELTAAIAGLQEFRERTELTVKSDSQYLIRGMNEWLDAWKERGWRKADNKPVENPDLWKRLNSLELRHRITWTWVRGHAGDQMNELADRLAWEAAQREAAKLADVP